MEGGCAEAEGEGSQGWGVQRRAPHAAAATAGVLPVRGRLHLGGGREERGGTKREGVCGRRWGARRSPLMLAGCQSVGSI